MRTLIFLLAMLVLPVVAGADVFTLAVGQRWHDATGIKLIQERQLVVIGRLAFPAKGGIKLIVEAERTATKEPNLKALVGVGFGF